MNGADLLEDGLPHGTTAGYDAGCRSLGGCPGKDGEWAQTCMTAKSRSRMEFGYSKAVAKGREVELLQGEADERRTPPPVPAKVARAKKSQQKQQGVPLPVARPRPPAPTPVAAELEQWPEETAPQQEGTRSTSVAKSQGAFASHPKQRDHALATASEEHSMGLTLTGEPRRRCAPGTVLVNGVLRRSDDVPEVAAAVPEPEVVAEEPEPTAPIPAPATAESSGGVDEALVDEEEPRPRGKRVLDDAVRTLAESLELQRVLAEIGERSLRTIRIEINHLRREAAAQQNQQEK